MTSIVNDSLVNDCRFCRTDVDKFEIVERIYSKIAISKKLLRWEEKDYVFATYFHKIIRIIVYWHKNFGLFHFGVRQVLDLLKKFPPINLIFLWIVFWISFPIYSNGKNSYQVTNILSNINFLPLDSIVKRSSIYYLVRFSRFKDSFGLSRSIF